MAIFTDNRFRFLGCLLIAGLLAGLAVKVIVSQSQIHSKPVDYRGDFEDIGYGLFGELSSEISSSMVRHRIEQEDFEKLDFTWPDQPGFGTNPEYEVFNPKSPRYIGTNRTPEIPKFVLRDITTDESTRVFFNLRHYTGPDGRIFDVLNAVIPNMKREACEFNGKSIHQFDANYSIPPNTHTIAMDGDWKSTWCAETPDHRLYLFSPLVSRFKEKESAPWLPMH